ncbi:alginate lyase family protein [Streptomyces griseorubiginosus]|uniref:alginate lyase family protein n=1 Tax=Streptomyces griseorubiginosus TaxID=67304 RepID=UPI003633DFB8
MTLQISRRTMLRAAGATTGAVGIGIGTGVAATPATAARASFAHPGMLHTQADLERMAAKVTAGAAPYTAGFAKLTGNRHSQSAWRPSPLRTPARGGSYVQNYGALYHDVHAAYQNALRWKITGDTAHADTARDICNAWSGTLKGIAGGSEVVLMAGLQGYQFANAGELLRGYPGFDLARFQDMLVNHFYPMNHDFLNRKTNCIGHYWANWDLCSMASVMAIGILCDDRAKFDETVDYFYNGEGNGALDKAIPHVYGDDLAQWQESGRDQGHSLLGIGLMGAICEMAWNQGVDLYGAQDSKFRKACEYVARYNLGRKVPYTSYTWTNGVHCVDTQETVISEGGRGLGRPVWARVYNHYANRRGLAMPNTGEMVTRSGPEGGGGDYGPNSGGFDELGFGTLAYTRDKATAAEATASPTPTKPTATEHGASSSSTPRAGQSSQDAGPQNPKGDKDLAASGTPDLTLWTAATGVTAIAGGLLLLRRRGQVRRDAE